MRRLYQKIFLSFFLVTLLFLVMWGIYQHWIWTDPEIVWVKDRMEALADELMPAEGASPVELNAVLERIGTRMPMNLALYSESGVLLAEHGEPVPEPDLTQTTSYVAGDIEYIPTFVLRLGDGRWLVAGATEPLPTDPQDPFLFISLVAIAGIGTFPLSRMLTRKLESLRNQTDALGLGDLSARVEVEGNDEVAELGRSFNRMAERLEELVSQQRSMLAWVSHELRTPLARLRVAIELLGDGEKSEVREKAGRDIRELDTLIAELLLASRLRSGQATRRRETVDLLGLMAEEAARTGAAVSGEPVQIEGDRSMLRIMVRNLLDNAQRYGGGSEVECTVSGSDLPAGTVRLTVSDRGPGVPADERERIFEPYYRAQEWNEGVAGGAGLGLALVREIAQHHGGDARCLPGEEGGSRFIVDLKE